MDRMIRDAEIGSDKKFHQILKSFNLRETHSAPLRLREFLDSLKIVRLHFGESYAHEKKRATLGWWIGELGVSGDADEVSRQVTGFFAKAGFESREEDDRGTPRWRFTLARNGVTQEAVVWAPSNWVGGQETACGTRVTWRVTDRTESPRTTLAKLLERFPQLREPRLDEELFRELGTLEVASLSAGGTWIKYYDWDVTLGDTSADALSKLLKKLSFSRTEKAKEFDVWERPKTGSWAWLYPADKSGAIRLRFQPES